ncbi:IS1106 transposase (fragment) [Neisseria meningitidis]
MRKACRNRPLSEAQTKRNRYLSKTRYVVEQSFGTLHRKFRYARAAYFGLIVRPLPPKAARMPDYRVSEED